MHQLGSETYLSTSTASETASGKTLLFWPFWYFVVVPGMQMETLWVVSEPIFFFLTEKFTLTPSVGQA
jgi:hypothetical protein